MKANDSAAEQRSSKRLTVLVLDSSSAQQSDLVQALSELGVSAYGADSEEAAAFLMGTGAFAGLFVGINDAAAGLELVRSASREALVTVVGRAIPPAQVARALAAGAMFVLQCSSNKAHLRSVLAVVKTALLARTHALPLPQPPAVEFEAFLGESLDARALDPAGVA